MAGLTDFGIALLGLMMLGIGLWWHDPGYSLAAVGIIIFISSALAASLRRKPPDA